MPRSVLVTLVPRVRWQRGDGTGGPGWPAPDGSPLVLAVPGEAVALHWLDLPDLAPAQAAAAARLALGDRLAEADPHIAVGPGDGAFGKLPDGGRRPVAVVAREQMAGWLAEAARAGWKPSAIIPDPLLLPAPASGWTVAQDGARVVARSASAAFAAEADLAAAIIGTDATTVAEPALPEVLPLDLLTGDYAPVTRWQPDRRQLRRLALLAAAVAGLWLGGDLAALLHARSTASAADAELVALAPGATDGASAFAALQAQAQQRGAAGGLAALAGPVVQALSARPGAGLASLTYTPAGGLVAGVAGGAGEAQALADALAGAGLAAAPGTTRATADGSISDVTVRAR